MMHHLGRRYSHIVLAVAEIIKDDRYLRMSEREFMMELVVATKARITPAEIATWYADLMQDGYGPNWRNMVKKDQAPPDETVPET